MGLTVLASCGNSNEPDANNLVTKIPATTHQTDFEKWLEKTLLIPYNIELRYRLDDNELVLSYPVVPANEAQSIRFAHILRHACLESYDETTGSKEFIRSTFPKLLQIVGSYRYSGSGTADEGMAEGGRKMTLFGINEIDFKNVDAMQATFKTVHHEFTHVLNQVKAYPTEFRSITSTSYVGESWNNRWNFDSNVAADVVELYTTAMVKELRATNATLKAEYEQLKLKIEGYEAFIKDMEPYIATMPEGAARTAMEKQLNENKAKLEAERPLFLAAKEAYETQTANMEANAEYKTWVAVGTRVMYYRGADGYASLNALQAGFISPYASATPDEDFAELQSLYIMETAEAWDAILKIAGPGAALIQSKMDIVRNYLLSKWQIDIDQLRSIVHRREGELSSLNIDNISL